MVGLVMLVVGIGALLVSGSVTRRRVGEAFGQVDDTSMRMSTGTGVVPKWVSLLNLVGWALIVVGLIVAVLSLL